MNKSIFVIAAGVRVANILDFSSSITREVETSGSALAVRSTDLTATLSRAILFDGPADALTLRSLSNFRLEFHTPKYTSVFKGCEWTSFSERIEEGRIIEQMTVKANGYSLVV